MELLGYLYDKVEIETFKLDGFILSHQAFSSYSRKSFNSNEIFELINLIHDKGKKAYLNLNQLYHDDKFEDLDNLFKELNVIDGIFFMDLGLLSLAKKYNLLDKMIYEPGTFNTNVLDVDFVKSLNIQGMTLSKEITLDDILAFKDLKENLKYAIVGHGYSYMFYSLRPLIKNFYEHKNIEREFLNKEDMYLIEEIRSEKYPIYEDEFGSYVFRGHKLISDQEFEKFNFIDMFKIERMFIRDEEYVDTINFYNDLKDGQSIINLREKYENFDSGFYYQNTVLNKRGEEVE